MTISLLALLLTAILFFAQRYTRRRIRRQQTVNRCLKLCGRVDQIDGRQSYRAQALFQFGGSR